MNWIILVIIAILSDAITVYFDNYITDVYFKERHSIAQRLFYGISYIIFASVLISIFGLDFSSAPITTFLTFFVSGVLSSLAGIPYYRALECDNSTNLGIFFQFAPILYLIFNWLFFGTSISPVQLIAIPVILAAPALIIFSSGKRSRNIRLKSMLLAFLSICISVIGNLLFVNNDAANLSFTDKIIPVLFGYGISNIVMILIMPKWRKRFSAVIKKHKRKVIVPMVCDAIMSITKVLSYRAALIFAPTVALASTASDAVEPIVIFFIGVIFTIIWPKFGRENLTRKSVRVHLIATILVVAGIILMQL